MRTVDLDFDRLYHFSDAVKRNALHVSPVETLRPPRDVWALLRGEWRPERPISFRRDSGSAPRDLIGTTDATFLVTDRLVELLTKDGVTGWDTYPVAIADEDGSPIGGYAGFVVRGRAGAVDDTRSRKVTRLPRSPHERPHDVWLGLYFDPSTWDGSDVFLPAGIGLVIVAERVKELLESHKVTNARFTRLSEYERMLLRG